MAVLLAEAAVVGVVVAMSDLLLMGARRRRISIGRANQRMHRLAGPTT
jgi:hypothetical protein